MTTSNPHQPSRRRLDPHRKFILERWIGLVSVNSITDSLSTMGCETSVQNLQKWIDRRVKDGSFPSREPSGLGRPRAKIALASSLGLLPLTKKLEDDVIPTIAFLLLNAPNIPIDLAEHAMDEMGIPQLEMDEVGDWLTPDWKGYAKQLGLARVRSLGDMDYFSLAAVFMDWTKDFQLAKTDTSWKKKWIPKVALAATNLRHEMLLAASGD